MKIIFARHGETVFGTEGRFEGLSNSPLTEKGKEQIIKLGEFCKRNNIKQIFASPIERSKVTASEISKVCKREIKFLDILKEICYGEWEQKSKIIHSTSSGQNSKLWTERKENLFKFVSPGIYKGHKGESYEMLFKRLKPFFEKLKKGSKTTIIVAHQGVMKCAKKYFENIDDNAFNNLSFPNNYVYIVDIDKENFSPSFCLV